MVNENEPQILAAQIIAAAIDRLTMAVDNSTVEIVEAVDRLSKAAKSPYWADMGVGITAIAALLVTIGTLLY